ncbi:MAG: calcium-binding protein, partial [Thermosynechococcaceae cyanobacterium]
GGGGNDTIIGDAANNDLRGEGGNDFIEGGGGNDTLFGGAGNDTVQGGDGNDLVFVRDFNGIDIFRGGRGIDTLFLQPSDNRNLLINVRGGFVGDSRVGGQNFTGFERIVGGGGNDTITGDAANNDLRGEAGNDFIEGGSGNDTLLGGAGNDTLIGGAGNDLVLGGAGQDRFVFQSIGQGLDILTDFSVVDDLLQFNSANFGGGLRAGSLAASQFVLGSAAQDTGDRFIYNQSAERLFFDVDGTGGVGAVEIARFTNNANLSANDIVIV